MKKERLERVLVNKLRTMLVRLLLDDQLEDKFMKHQAEMNQQHYATASDLETEIKLLEKQINQMEQDLFKVRGKA